MPADSVAPAPLLPAEPGIARRDPAALEVDGTMHVFHTVVRTTASPPELWIEVTTSDDLRSWTPPRRVTPPGPNFSSPGNILRWGDEWVMCLQSYPIRPGEQYGDGSCRLWLSRSTDLALWSDPEEFGIDGPDRSLRRIDPFLVVDGDRVLCLHKAVGQIAALQSTDLEVWSPVRGGEPVFPASLTPDGCTIENPAVVRDGDAWILFFSAVREGRGIGVARSSDLEHWSPGRYLDLPPLPWAPGGPTAATVVPTPARPAPWTMFLHGDGLGAHGGELTVVVADALDGPWRALGDAAQDRLL
jgi:hypothetical protein